MRQPDNPLPRFANAEDETLVRKSSTYVEQGIEIDVDTPHGSKPWGVLNFYQIHKAYA